MFDSKMYVDNAKVGHVLNEISPGIANTRIEHSRAVYIIIVGSVKLVVICRAIKAFFLASLKYIIPFSIPILPLWCVWKYFCYQSETTIYATKQGNGVHNRVQ